MNSLKPHTLLSQGKDEVKPVEEKKVEPVTEEKSVEEKKEEAPVVSDELKKFQERVAALEAENARLKEKEKPAEAPVVEEEEEVFLTSKNADEILNKREQAKQERIKAANTAYQKSYEAGLAQLAATVDKDLFPEIFETMIANNGQNEFNQRSTGDAAVDVQLNFAKAQAHVYKQKAGKIHPSC